jgi:acyl dehydratase
VRFDLDSLGRATADRSFTVERDRLAAYAAATNETDPSLVSGELGPTVFAIVPVWETIRDATKDVVPDEARPTVVHGEQDMFLHRPIRPGMELASHAAVVGVHPKQSGTTVVVKTETRDTDGALVNEQYVTEFYRGVVADDGGGEPAPDHRFPEGLSETEPLAAIGQRIDEDQTFRYAEASGDHFEIHLDESAAQKVGLPGIIVHGLCVMAFTGRAVLEAAGGGELSRLAVRFARPVRPGETIVTRLWEAGPGAYVFETSNPAGDLVLRDGRAEVRS